MIKLLCVLSAVVAFSYAANDCPPFGEWLPWTEQCLWFPLAHMSKGMADACQTTFNYTRGTPTIPMPTGWQMPERCGHCSFKLRCRKRGKKEGCLSIDPQKEVCHEFGQVCSMTPHPEIGCRWNVLMAGLKNCANRPDITDWRRDAYRKFADGLPEGNCIEKDGQCKCCCHPYTPSEDGTQCVKQPEHTCEPFGPYNEWSQCLWFPMANIAKGIKEHCQLELKGDLPTNLFSTPPGFKIPEQCGYCSFRARCRRREKKEGCMHIDGEKKACGNDDCPSCGNICTIPKIGDQCELGKTMAKTLVGKADMIVNRMPYWKQRGIKRLMRHIPYGKCKEVNGQCKCCCHPYEPNEDGTQCVLSQVCAIDPTH